MKKLERRFEAVPITEALRSAGQAQEKKLVVEKIEKKDEPYAVPARAHRQGS